MAEAAAASNGGRYSEAITRYEAGMKIAGEGALLARTANDLAAAHYAAANYEQAEALYLRSLALWEKIPGDPNIAGVLSNLAALYIRQARYADGERLCRRALEIPHSDATELAVRSNLGELYRRHAATRKRKRRSRGRSRSGRKRSVRSTRACPW